jgi:hypothetical protein
MHCPLLKVKLSLKERNSSTGEYAGDLPDCGFSVALLQAPLRWHRMGLLPDLTCNSKTHPISARLLVIAMLSLLTAAR